MNSNEIEAKLKEKDNLILKQNEILEPLQVEKHNLEVKILELSEAIRQGKKLLSKFRLEKEMLERDKWIAIKQERGY